VSKIFNKNEPLRGLSVTGEHFVNQDFHMAVSKTGVTFLPLAWCWAC